VQDIDGSMKMAYGVTHNLIVEAESWRPLNIKVMVDVWSDHASFREIPAHKLEYTVGKQREKGDSGYAARLEEMLQIDDNTECRLCYNPRRLPFAQCCKGDHISRFNAAIADRRLISPDQLMYVTNALLVEHIDCRNNWEPLRESLMYKLSVVVPVSVEFKLPSVHIAEFCSRLQASPMFQQLHPGHFYYLGYQVLKHAKGIAPLADIQLFPSGLIRTFAWSFQRSIGAAREVHDFCVGSTGRPLEGSQIKICYAISSFPFIGGKEAYTRQLEELKDIMLDFCDGPVSLKRSKTKKHATCSWCGNEGKTEGSAQDNENANETSIEMVMEMEMEEGVEDLILHKLQKCSRCRQTNYCSTECQK